MRELACTIPLPRCVVQIMVRSDMPLALEMALCPAQSGLRPIWHAAQVDVPCVNCTSSTTQGGSMPCAFSMLVSHSCNEARCASAGALGGPQVMHQQVARKGGGVVSC